MESVELFKQPLKPFFFPALYQLSDQVRGRIEANVSALGTGGKRQGANQVGFTGSGVSDQQNVFSFVQVLPPQKLPDQRLIDRGLDAKVIITLTKKLF